MRRTLPTLAAASVMLVLMVSAAGSRLRKTELTMHEGPDWMLPSENIDALAPEYTVSYADGKYVGVGYTDDGVAAVVEVIISKGRIRTITVDNTEENKWDAGAVGQYANQIIGSQSLDGVKEIKGYTKMCEAIHEGVENCLLQAEILPEAENE